MKKLFILFVFIITTAVATAKVITVSNNPNTPGQFSTIQEAVDFADAGDTIYVHASATWYSNAGISKPLTIIGGGTLPENKNLPLNTNIESLNLVFDGPSSASGSSIYGCKINSIVYYTNPAGTANISNISIERCKIGGISTNFKNTPGISWSVRNNIIGSISVGLENSLIKNNIIRYIGNSLSSFGTLLITNNIIYSAPQGLDRVIITNNIFSSDSGTISATSNQNCTFTKNIFYAAGDPYNAAVFNSNTNSGTGNIVNVDPGFVRPVAFDTLNNYSYTNPATGPFADFNLKANSVGKGLGTDGTDVGIYGGTTPFFQGATTDSRFRYFPKPAIPQMLDVTISNTAIPVNGTLSVTISAAKQD